jgi:DNA (cytosine-5)-methyltransferase 1
VRYLSICSGIEAASVAWHPLGWQPAGFSEIEPFPRAVLEQRLGAVPVDWDHRHRPGSNTVPLFGDFTKIEAHHVGPVDLLVGGTPCQSFSVAGKRLGLDDPRGHLTLEFLALAQRVRPRWIVWENVPGVLSDDGGRTFGTFLGLLGELGYGWAYRVLDAQFARVGGFERAVPQRRRRVFVVGHLGDPSRAAAVLFDRESLRGNPAPRRKAGEGTAGTIGARTCRSIGADDAANGHLISLSSGQANAEIRTDGGAPSLTCLHEAPIVAHSLRAEGFDASEDGTGRQNLVPIRRYNCPNCGFGMDAEHHCCPCCLIAFDTTQITSPANRSNPQPGDACHPLAAGAHAPAVAFSFKDSGNDATVETSPTLRSLGAYCANGGSQMAVAFATTIETVYGDNHADADEADAYQALRALREAVGEEAYSKWCTGILAAFRTPEVLRSKVHGRSVRWARDDWHELGDDALPRPETGGAWAVLTLWEAGCVGRAPRGWKPSEQLARQLVAHLSRLPHQGASAERFLHDLRRACEGLGLLREALSAVQEAWRSERRQKEPARLGWAVRRLTPVEAERLQGFPDNFTQIPWRGKPAEQCPDGPRYKALGNSMAVNVMRWIGQRIAIVDAATAIESAAPWTTRCVGCQQKHERKAR